MAHHEIAGMVGRRNKELKAPIGVEHDVTKQNAARAISAPPSQWDEEADVVVLGYGGGGP